MIYSTATVPVNPEGKPVLTGAQIWAGLERALPRSSSYSSVRSSTASPIIRNSRNGAQAARKGG